jgi:hypothetical protein
MLRVDATNLPSPRGIPRSRRLLPNPPNAARRSASARHELVPPPDDKTDPTLVRPLPAAAPLMTERWSVRLELGDDDIAKLYGQGMTRGAVVWKKGMVEWRPLLITPELSGLLRRTRTTLTETPPVPYVSEELTVPRPPRVPENMAAPLAPPPAAQNVDSVPPESEVRRFTTVAPTALDVDPPRTSSRRGVELAAVAVAAFALAWLTHSRFEESSTKVAASASLSAPAAVAPVSSACEPAATASKEQSSSGSSIPTVAVADLPLAGRGTSSLIYASTGSAKSSASTPRATHASDNSRPSRSDLVGALGQVARAAGGCGERGGPARVVITFAPSGVARSIQVSGSGLPSQTRSCIIGAASRARVPAFSGDPVTVSKTL